MSAKLQISFAIDGTITKVILETMTVISHVYGGIYMNITQALVIMDFQDVSKTLIDKNDSSDPLKRKDYWGCTLCTMEPYGLNIDDHV